ncbi:MAG: spermidine/putrescine ABC transporter substrate-binding protein [Polyangiaceae bacterium]|nr:spermidine/putrescine ABC transporter substrate-binding protein [Polyangiaceae bacterium]
MYRRSLFALALAITTLGLACSSGGSGSAGPAPSGTAQATQKEARKLVVYGWSEYIPDAVIQGFTKETGVTVLSETFSSNEEMLSKLLAGGTPYDLIQPSEYMVEALAKQNLLMELTPAAVPNLKNIDPNLRGLPHDPNYKYCAPYMAGTVGIVVNTEKVKDPVKGYKDVFQEKYKGRIVAVNDAREMVAWSLSTLGIGPNDITPETLDKAKPVLSEWVKFVKVFDSDSPKTALLNGDVDLGVVWSGEAAILYEKNKKFTFVLPDEGAHLYIDHLCIPSGAGNKTDAEKFINYVLRPEVSKLVSDKFPYLNPNIEARALLTEAQRQNPASYPPALMSNMKKASTFRDIGKISTDVDKLVTDLKAQN